MVQLLKGLADKEFTYEDITLLDGTGDFAFKDIDTSTMISRRNRIKIPIISAAMYTVTNSNLAIALALEGGIGILPFSNEETNQIQELRRVKRHQAGFVEPVTLSPKHLVDDAVKIRKDEKHGYSRIPITEDGSPHGTLVGVLTDDDYSMYRGKHKGWTIASRMTQISDLPVLQISELPADDEERIEYANQRLLDTKRGELPIVGDKGELLYLVTRTDIEIYESHSNASMDKKRRLMVGVAIGTRQEHEDTIPELVKEGADLLVIDTSHARHKIYVYDLIKRIKDKYDIDVVVGNTASAEGVRELVEAGADGVKVGMSVGQICTTGETTGVYRQQGSAVYECSIVGRETGTPIIADGGIREPGDITKAHGLGASAVMIGGLLAGTEESPGKVIEVNGRLVKEYKGMGSEDEMRRGGTFRYGNERVPEGVSGTVPYRGPISVHVPKMVKGFMQGMEKVGGRTLDELYLNARFVPVSEGGRRERGVHDLVSYRR